MEKEIVLIYGAGKLGTFLCRLANIAKVMEVHIVDSSSEKWGKIVEGYVVESPREIYKYKNDKYCIAVANEDFKQQILRGLIDEYEFIQDNEFELNDLEMRLFESIFDYSAIKVKEWDEDINKRRIVFSSIKGLGLGGIEAWIKDVTLQLRHEKFENIAVLTAMGGYHICKDMTFWEEEMDFDIVSMDKIEIWENIYKYLSKHLPCVVITEKLNETFIVAVLLKKYFPDSIRIITVCHAGLKEAVQSYAKYDKWIDAYVGVSEDIREILQDLKINKEKIYKMQIPFACDERLNREYVKDNSRPIMIGYAGRVTYKQKRIDLMMKLVLELEKRSIDYVMNVAGNGDALEDLKEFTKNNNLSKKIIFSKRIDRDKISVFWKQQDICINLADYEGRSISITEAMGNGAVPIVTDTSGVKEDISNNVNGYIVSLGDYQEMADKIEYLYYHREKIKKMGHMAHDVVYPKSQMKQHIVFWKMLLLEKIWN